MDRDVLRLVDAVYLEQPDVGAGLGKALVLVAGDFHRECHLELWTWPGELDQ